VGETGADFLNFNLHLGLGGTSIVMALVLAVALVMQMRAAKYVPWRYWLVVVLVSIVGTLITDNLTDGMHVPLRTTTAVFALVLPVVFGIWYAMEKTLSVHFIDTSKREAFYWLAILLTFALGTAAGDLLAEDLHLGYALSAIVFAGLIAVIAAAWRMGFDATTSFWLAYVLTRPLGASLGDYLAQDPDEGGLGLGVNVSTGICLVAIVATVAYVTITARREAARAPA
jgi:uncharacterized membrane-anchored protein